MKRQVKDAGKALLWKLHRTAMRSGVVVLPKHYYTPIADVGELERTRGNWSRRSSMTGIVVDIARQAALLKEAVEPFESEYRLKRNYKEGQAKGYGPGFGYIEAQCLHGVLRWLKPKRIIESGPACPRIAP